MILTHISNFKGGWFLGSFHPTLLNTDQFEVALKHHKVGEKWKAHYQKKATEYNVLVSGMMKMNEKVISPGTIFVMEPKEICKPVFMSDCYVVCVKVPSLPKDKVEVE